MLKNRQLFLWGEVGPRVSKYIVQSLRILSRKPDPIYLFINSPGGYITDALAIVDEIQATHAKGVPVATIAQGEACSSGGLILALGSPGWRYCTENSTVMLHAWSLEMPEDTASKHKRELDFTDTQITAINKLVANACGIRTKAKLLKFEQDLERTIWLNAQQAIKFGICDEIWKGPGVN